MNPEILARVIRGETTESIHRGHLYICDGDGQEIASLGAPETVTYFRSAAKAFQALPFITSGAAERFGFLEQEIALACASHSGEPIHTELAAKMLAKAGFTEADLKCGAHDPFNDAASREMIRHGEKPTQLHNNCSGKHAAMLAFAKHIGADPRTYDLPDNPIQKEILKVVSKFTDVPESDIKIGIDGCAAPNFALSVKAMALSYAKLILPPADLDEETREACRRCISAMMAYPELIGGSERLDTKIMQALPGKIISKVGADGVYLAGVLPSPKWKRGLGIAFKVEDGDDYRARPVVATEVLRQLGILDEKASEMLKDFAPLPVKNKRGDIVGRVEADFSIKMG